MARAYVPTRAEQAKLQQRQFNHALARGTSPTLMRVDQSTRCLWHNMVADAPPSTCVGTPVKVSATPQSARHVTKRHAHNSPQPARNTCTLLLRFPPPSCMHACDLTLYLFTRMHLEKLAILFTNWIREVRSTYEAHGLTRRRIACEHSIVIRGSPYCHGKRRLQSWCWTRAQLTC